MKKEGSSVFSLFRSLYPAPYAGGGGGGRPCCLLPSLLFGRARLRRRRRRRRKPPFPLSPYFAFYRTYSLACRGERSRAGPRRREEGPFTKKEECCWLVWASWALSFSPFVVKLAMPAYGGYTIHTRRLHGMEEFYGMGSITGSERGYYFFLGGGGAWAVPRKETNGAFILSLSPKSERSVL